MAYTAPTYTDFITRFPAFDNQTTYPQAMVEAVLVEATNNIDETWLEQDYAIAIMYQTAHILTMDNAVESASQAGPATFLQSESFSGMSMSYGKVSDGSLSQSEIWGGSSYGRRYLDLLRKNKGGPVVA